METDKKMFNKKDYFQFFGAIDGSKAVDISLLEYKKDIIGTNGNPIYVTDSQGQIVYKKNERGEFILKDGNKIPEPLQETKGFRIKFEATTTGWKEKSIIILQDSELAEIISVLEGSKKTFKTQRQNKVLTIENQGEHSFFTFFSKEESGNKNYAMKIDGYSGLRFSLMSLYALQLEFKRTLGVLVSGETLKETIRRIYGTQEQKTTTTNNTQTKDSTFVETSGGVVEGNGVKCSKCSKDFDLPKEQKVIDFSTKKYGHPVCYNCQKLQ